MATPIVNPTYSGSTITFSNTSQCVLTVGSSVVPLYDSRFNLTRYSVTFEGKELSFTEIPTPDVSNPTYALEDSVSLQLDLGSGLVTYFVGTLKKRQHQGRNREPLIEYVAVGQFQRANEVPLCGASGLPLYQKFNGTSILTISATQVVYGGGVQTAITHIFTLNNTRLDAAGISSTIGTPGLSSISTLVNVPRDLSIQNQGFSAGLKQVCDYYPRVKPYYSDVQSAWVFVDLFSAPEVIVDVSSVNMPEHVYEMSVDGRYTAIYLVAPFDGRMALSSKGTAVCTPAWDSAKEADWCVQLVGQSDPADPAGGYAAVYRKWTIPLEGADVDPHCPYRAYALFNYQGQTVYQVVQAQIDLQEGVIWAYSPVVIRGNAYHPGNAVGPDAVVFTWYSLDSVPFPSLAQIRVPTSGYEGTAYTKFGIERTKYELVDATQITGANAQAKLDLLKDVVISGELVLEGDPIAELMELNRRIYVTSSARTTGVESLSMLQMGYTYEFGKRGRNVISVTTDRSGLIRVN